MSKKYACVPLWGWILMMIVSVLLYLYPQVDIAVSSRFYAGGEGFLQHGALWERMLYRSVPIVLSATYVGALLLWIYNRIRKENLYGFSGKKLLYLLFVGALGSGIIVNAALKDHWGRARPAQTIAFGGEKAFAPPFVFSDQGGKSFSSGHTSGAFALLALIFLARRHRKRIAAAVIGYGLAVSLARIAAGGHFLSDVIVSIFIMYIVAAGLYRWMFGCEKESYGV
ncbi:MAG TPA: phosphatase PAP2 family protein [Sulfuricurvum sp.]|nr:phosphatase PAP2 family protein [Sulfuricurvum sp.]